jgi:hypothetical protein
MRTRIIAGALLTAGLLATPATALADSVRITSDAPDSVRITNDSVRITDDSVRITADSVRITATPDDKIW